MASDTGPIYAFIQETIIPKPRALTSGARNLARTVRGAAHQILRYSLKYSFAKDDTSLGFKLTHYSLLSLRPLRACCYFQMQWSIPATNAADWWKMAHRFVPTATRRKFE